MRGWTPLKAEVVICLIADLWRTLSVSSRPIRIFHQLFLTLTDTSLTLMHKTTDRGIQISLNCSDQGRGRTRGRSHELVETISSVVAQASAWLRMTPVMGYHSALMQVMRTRECAPRQLHCRHHLIISI